MKCIDAGVQHRDDHLAAAGAEQPSLLGVDISSGLPAVMAAVFKPHNVPLT